jgi:hypothetical protein
MQTVGGKNKLDNKVHTYEKLFNCIVEVTRCLLNYTLAYLVKGSTSEQNTRRPTVRGPADPSRQARIPMQVTSTEFAARARLA